MEACAAELLKYRGIRGGGQRIEPKAGGRPGLQTRLEAKGGAPRRLTWIPPFGTPQDVTAYELRIASFFPADAQSEMLLRQLAASAPKP